MSVFGPNHSGDLLVGTTYSTDTDSLDFINGVAAVDEDLQVFSEDGSAVAAGTNFKVFQKAAGAKAGFEFSEVVEVDKINYVKADAYTAPTSRALQIEGFTGTPRDHVTYEVWIRLYNDGGALSPENFRMIPAFYVTPADASGVTFITILNALKADMDATLLKQGLDSALTVSVDTGSGYFIVTGSNQSFSLGKKDGRPVEFDLQGAVRENGSDTTTPGNRYDDLSIVTNAAGAPGVGTGHQAANLEWFYKGYKYSRYREVAAPNNFPQNYYVDPSSVYHVIVISYYKERPYQNVEKQHRLLYILVEAIDPDGGGGETIFTAVNAVISDLETATGLTIGALS